MTINVDRRDIIDVLLYRRQVREAVAAKETYGQATLDALKGCYPFVCPVSKALLRATDQLYAIIRVSRGDPNEPKDEVDGQALEGLQCPPAGRRQRLAQQVRHKGGRT